MTPLSAGGFITACPETNPDLPVQTFPALTVTPAAPVMGQNISLSYNGTGAAAGAPTYMAWYHDMNTTFTTIHPDGVTTVPDGLRGTVFAGVVKNTTAATTSDATMLSGLAILTFPYDSYAIVGA